jgi:hypothetical protein
MALRVLPDVHACMLGRCAHAEAEDVRKAWADTGLPTTPTAWNQDDPVESIGPCGVAVVSSLVGRFLDSTLADDEELIHTVFAEMPHEVDIGTLVVAATVVYRSLGIRVKDPSRGLVCDECMDGPRADAKMGIALGTDATKGRSLSTVAKALLDAGMGVWTAELFSFMASMRLESLWRASGATIDGPNSMRTAVFGPEFFCSVSRSAAAIDVAVRGDHPSARRGVGLVRCTGDGPIECDCGVTMVSCHARVDGARSAVCALTLLDPRWNYGCGRVALVSPPIHVK